MLAIFSRLAARFPDPTQGPADAPLCMGGDLEPIRLLAAYSCGIFPWFGPGLPLLWWSPDPRCVLLPEEFHLPRRSARALRASTFTLTLDAAFGRVISACAAPRAGADGTWITPQMATAYERLHALGYAHSVETWRGQELVGGLYGVALGGAFFGESMFHTESEASRAALAGLVGLLKRRGVSLLDCQQATPHMERMGARLLPRDVFLRRLADALGPASAEVPGEEGEPRLSPWAPWRERYRFCGPCGDASAGAWAERS